MPTEMALYHLNLILNIWFSLPLSWVEEPIPCVLRFPHHGEHCLQLTVGIKLIEIFAATEKKYERERKRIVAWSISSEVSQERQLGLERSETKKKQDSMKREAFRRERNQPLTCSDNWLAKGSDDTKRPVKRADLPLAFGAPWLTIVLCSDEAS